MSRSTQVKPEPIRDRKWIIPVGKYKGMPLEEVMGIDAHYVIWLAEHTQYELHSDLMDELETDYNEAMLQAFRPSKKEIEDSVGSLSDFID